MTDPSPEQQAELKEIHELGEEIFKLFTGRMNSVVGPVLGTLLATYLMGIRPEERQGARDHFNTLVDDMIASGGIGSRFKSDQRKTH